MRRALPSSQRALTLASRAKLLDHDGHELRSDTEE